MATLNDLGDAALNKLGVVQVGGTMDATQDALVLAETNRMLATWSNDGMKIPSTTITSLTLTASKQSYTIGSSGDFNTTRPQEILAANVFNVAGTNIISRLTIRDSTWWAGRRPRTETDTLPRDLFYNPEHGANARGTIFLSPTPSKAYIMELHSSAFIGPFAAISTTVALQPGYEDLIIHGLAKRLWPVYPNPVVVQSIDQGYREALKAIRDKNSTVPKMITDYPGRQSQGRRIKSGDWA